MTTEQRPSVGRVVHYVSRGSADGVFPSKCRAATVTEVDEANPQRVGLVVTNPTGLFFHSLADGGALYDEGQRFESGTTRLPDGGTWHWPERV